MVGNFDVSKEYDLFLDYLENEIKGNSSEHCKIILEDIKKIRGNYTKENKRKITGIVFMLRELEQKQIPIFSEWYKYVKK